LAEDDYLDKIYDKLLAKIDEIEKAINDKLAFYNFPDTEKQIKEKIFESLKEFLENKLNDLLEDFKQYISDKEQICELKVKEEKQKVNEILDKYYNIYVLTGQDILNYIENLQKEIQQILPTLILPENKNLLQKIYWQLEIKKIDELIKNQNLDRFDIKYPDIEQTIYEIIESIAEEYKKK
jgi:ATP-dependent exoDNAse (exonuclease V) alpha subunit